MPPKSAAVNARAPAGRGNLRDNDRALALVPSSLQRARAPRRPRCSRATTRRRPPSTARPPPATGSAPRFRRRRSEVTRTWRRPFAAGEAPPRTARRGAVCCKRFVASCAAQSSRKPRSRAPARRLCRCRKLRILQLLRWHARHNPTHPGGARLPSGVAVERVHMPRRL
jgi:hypothetical protein